MDADRTAEQILANRHADKQHASDNFILANDSLKVWGHLSSSEKADGGTLHIVLDNAGAELVMDLCLADWMVTRAKLFTKVVFHCKTIPWFVSDTMEKDVEWTLAELEKQADDLKPLIARWRHFFATATWQCRPHPFWASFHAYYDLEAVAPELKEEMCSSPGNLILFKGDLNYRKLVYDCQWPFDTPFSEAIGPLREWSAPVLALRTCKSDVVVGVAKNVSEEMDKTVGKNDGAKGWLVTGRYAIVQFNK